MSRAGSAAGVLGPRIEAHPISANAAVTEVA